MNLGAFPREARRVIRLALLATLLAVSSTALAQDVWTEPHPGIRYLRRSTSEPKRVHALLIDLSRPEITLRSTRQNERGRTPSSFAALVGAVAAVNGDFYNTNGSFDPVGLAIGEGTVWSPDPAGHNFLACTQDKACLIDLSGTAVAADPSWWSAVGGNTRLVRNGAVIQTPQADTSCGAFCTTEHPRTAAGLSADRRTLILVVVEGRQTPILGMTTHRLAQLMVELGADVALNLDGGGSSSMVLDGRRVSGRPSNEPNERPVANHIAILYDPSPPTTGRLVGFIREGDINDATAGLAGASVALSSGERATADARGFYEFAAVTAGDVTVTAELAGFRPESEPKTVVAGITNWKSIALVRNQPDAGLAPDAPPMDAAQRDAAAIDAAQADAASPIDGGDPVDAGARTDGGLEDVAPPPVADAGADGEPEVVVDAGSEGGGCRCVGRGSASPLVLLALALIFARGRRFTPWS
jgi:hypothetical protein